MNLEYPSKNDYASHLATVFSTSSINGNGKRSCLVATFNFLKSTQILSFPFFFGIIIIDDNQVASSTSCMKPTANNLSISYLTSVA